MAKVNRSALRDGVALVELDDPDRYNSLTTGMVNELKAIFADAPVEHAGETYQASGFTGAPRPVQKPHPPIMIGGGGRRVLSLAAREADVVSLNFDNRSGKLGPEGVQSGSASRNGGCGVRRNRARTARA